MISAERLHVEPHILTPGGRLSASTRLTARFMRGLMSDLLPVICKHSKNTTDHFGDVAERDEAIVKMKSLKGWGNNSRTLLITLLRCSQFQERRCTLGGNKVST